MFKSGGRWMLRGIVATSLLDFETRTCDVNNYSVYTDVAHFTVWIQNIVENEN